jgi:hypothetical protein
MITDKENTFFDNILPALDGVLGDVVKITNRQFVPGLFAYVQVETPVTDATSVRLQFVSSATSDLGTPTVHFDTGVVALATFNAAKRYVTALPVFPATHNFCGWINTIGGTDPTAGGLTGGIVESATLESNARPSYHTGRT